MVHFYKFGTDYEDSEAKKEYSEIFVVQAFYKYTHLCCAGFYSVHGVDNKDLQDSKMPIRLDGAVG